MAATCTVGPAEMDVSSQYLLLLLCQSSTELAEISRPSASTSKEEAGSRGPGCRYSLYSAPIYLQGQNKADKMCRGASPPHTLLSSVQTILSVSSLKFVQTHNTRELIKKFGFVIIMNDEVI